VPPTVPPDLATLIGLSPSAASTLPIVAVALAVAYATGAVRLWTTGRRWSPWRSASFLLGCAALWAISGLGVDDYGRVLLSVFMFQQLTLLMVVPALLVLGSPGTLLLRATPHAGLGRTVLRISHAGLRSPVTRLLLQPWVTVPLYLLAFYGLYLAGWADIALSMDAGHRVLEAAFLVIGILLAAPVLSSDPLPVRMSHGARALDVFIEAALHAFFGVLMMMSGTVLVTSFAATTAGLGIDPIADQQIAGGLAWSYGEAPTLLALLWIMHRWYTADTAASAAADRSEDRDGAPELAAYNAYLKELDRET